MPQTFQQPGRTAGLLPWLPIVVSLAHLMPQADMNYGAAYFFYDYSHGFVKRGLLGALFSHVHYLSRTNERLILLAILAATVWLTYATFRKALFQDARMTPVTVMLLSAPALLPHFFTMFIPTDPLLYCAAVLSVWLFLKGKWGSAWLGSLVACIVALLIHEAFSVRMYPVVIAVMMELCRRGKLRWSMAVLHVGIMLAAFVLIFHFGTLTTSTDVFFAEAQARAGFKLLGQVFFLMRQTGAGASRDSMALVMSRATLQGFALTYCIALPYIAAVVYILRRAMRAAAMPTLQKVSTAAAFCSPLLLMPVATDWMRWLSDCLICASLFILYLYTADREDGPVRESMGSIAASPNLTFLIGYVIAIGPFAGMWIESSNFILHGYFDRF